MPLFGKKSTQPTVATATTNTTTAPRASTSSTSSRRSGFLSSHRHHASTSPIGADAPAAPVGNKATSKNPFSRAFNSNKHTEDPAVTAARQRVANAEMAEREADRALLNSRTAVRDARADVVRLEAEAAEDAKLAKIKQGQARHLGKRARPLGKHGLM